MFPLTRLQKILLILFIISGLIFVGVMIFTAFQPTRDAAGPEAATATVTEAQVMVISTAAAAVASCLSTVISLLAFLFTVWLETRRNSV